jgi:hypothetical protein
MRDDLSLSLRCRECGNKFELSDMRAGDSRPAWPVVPQRGFSRKQLSGVFFAVNAGKRVSDPRPIRGDRSLRGLWRIPPRARVPGRDSTNEPRRSQRPAEKFKASL